MADGWPCAVQAGPLPLEHVVSFLARLERMIERMPRPPVTVTIARSVRLCARADTHIIDIT
jgi:hypothetical protein